MKKASSTSSSLPSKNKNKSTINKLKKLRRIKLKIIQKMKMMKIKMTIAMKMMKNRKVN